MLIFHSYVSLPEGIKHEEFWTAPTGSLPSAASAWYSWATKKSALKQRKLQELWDFNVSTVGLSRLSSKNLGGFRETWSRNKNEQT